MIYILHESKSKKKFFYICTNKFNSKYNMINLTLDIKQISLKKIAHYFSTFLYNTYNHWKCLYFYDILYYAHFFGLMHYYIPLGLGLTNIDILVIEEELAINLSNFSIIIIENNFVHLFLVISGTRDQELFWFNMFKKKHLLCSWFIIQLSYIKNFTSHYYIVNNRKLILYNLTSIAWFLVLIETKKKKLTAFIIRSRVSGIKINNRNFYKKMIINKKFFYYI